MSNLDNVDKELKGMNKNKELAFNTAIIIFGKMCTQFLSFLLLPLYTAVLETDEYGTFDYVITVVTLIIPFLYWQIEDAVFRFLIENRDNEEEKSKIISTVIVYLVKHSCMALIIYCCIYKYLNPSYRIFLVLNTICNYMSSLSLQIARGLGKNIVYSMGSSISAVVTLICNVLFITVLNMKFEGMLLALCVGNMCCVVYVFLYTKMYKYIDFGVMDNSLKKDMLKYSLPLIPNLLAWSIIGTSDRIVLTTFLGTAATGVFSVAHKFPSIFATIYNLFNISWTESVTLHIHEADGNQFVEDIINRMFSFFLSIAIGIIACMPFVFPILVNEKYQEGYNQIPILMIGTMLNVIIGLLSVIYIALKNTKQIAKSSVVSAIINLVFSLAFIKVIGIYAASISTVIAYLIMAIYRYYDINKYTKIKISSKRIIGVTLTTIAVCFCYYYPGNVVKVVGLLIACVFAFVTNKEMLFSIYKVAKNKISKLRNRNY